MTPRIYRELVIFLAALISMATATAQPAERQPRPPARPEDRVRTEPARPEPIPNAQISVWPLKFADAESVARTLQNLQPALGECMMAIPLGRSNSVVVASQGDEQEARIKSLIASLDQPGPSPATEAPNIQSVRFQHTPARGAMEIIDRLYALRAQPSSLRVEVDERSNTLWLSGREQLVASAVRLAQQIDEGAPGPAETSNVRELRFYTLAHADAGRLAGTLNEIAKSMELGVYVVPDRDSATLIVYASPAQDAELQKMVAKLDVPSKRPPGPEAPPEPPAKAPPPPRGVHAEG